MTSETQACPPKWMAARPASLGMVQRGLTLKGSDVAQYGLEESTVGSPISLEDNGTIFHTDTK